MTQQVLHSRTVFIDSQTLEDNASVSMYFEATGSNTGLNYADVDTYVQAFFNTIPTGGSHPVSYYMGSQLSRTSNATITYHTDITAHLDGSPAGPPFQATAWTLGAAANTNALPPALALLFSYRAAYGTDTERGVATSLPSTDQAIDQGAPATHTGTPRPRARDRGRFYVGPLDLGVLPNGAPPNVIPTAIVSNLQKSMDQLCEVHFPGQPNQFNMVQWSRRNAAVKQIGFFWIGETFVTQRRRSDTATSRVHSWSTV